MYYRACDCPKGHPKHPGADPACCALSTAAAGLGATSFQPARDAGKFYQRKPASGFGIEASNIGPVITRREMRGQPNRTRPVWTNNPEIGGVPIGELSFQDPYGDAAARGEAIAPVSTTAMIVPTPTSMPAPVAVPTTAIAPVSPPTAIVGDAGHFMSSYFGCFISPLSKCSLAKKLVVAGGLAAIVGVGIYFAARQS